MRVDIPKNTSRAIKRALRSRLPSDVPVGHCVQVHKDGAVDIKWTPEAWDIIQDVLVQRGEFESADLIPHLSWSDLL